MASNDSAKKSRWEVDDDGDDLSKRPAAHKKPAPRKRPAPHKRKHSEAEETSEPNKPSEPNRASEPNKANRLLPTHLAQDYPCLSSCRRLSDCYERLNKIEEGTYGIVYRARDLRSNETVALKQLKLDQERNGFPITALREIHTLLLAKHPNIVNVREIVVGTSLNSIYMVMDFMQHDLRSLMEVMRTPFSASEVKALVLQLCRAVAHLHDNWIVHRDLKTSNLLMADGVLCVADFGLARKFSSPLGHMTGLVVTLWYRAPELLLGAAEYSTAVDMWSVGCIFAELFAGEPVLQGRGEIDQINRIFAACGTPTRESWPGFDRLPNAGMFKLAAPRDPARLLRTRLRRYDGVTDSALDLLLRMLALDPAQRISASQALDHPYFAEHPPPKDPSMFPTWPSNPPAAAR
ncbi:hypothetical protein IWW51_001515 [Coemansia sp. RSA 2702]|nr:hypothetical protein IWW51_001515 [Coemansia sp. RSA 2702]